jgi:hypothetical protein
MRFVWVLAGGSAGAVGGAALGFGVALVAMSVTKSRNDGTYGMVQMMFCVPGGVILGLITGIIVGLKMGAR